MKRGNCYVTCEALYHLMGGKAAGLKPMTVKHEGDTHWFLVMTRTGNAFPVIIDPTVKQFKTFPNYLKARGRGFLTKEPSKRAKKLMKEMLWQK